MSKAKLLVCAFFASILLLQLGAQPLPPRLREALKGSLQASEEQLKQIEGGGVVAYIIDTKTPEDIMLVGVGRIWASPAFFVQQYRNITEFESAPGISAGGVFSHPPRIEDVAGLAFTKDEADDFRKCKPGDCDFKIGDAGLARLQHSIDWSRNDYTAQLNTAVRQLWIEGLKRYQQEGNAALAKYHDKPQMFSAAEGLEQLMKKTPVLQQVAPGMYEYLSKYPQAKVPSAEEFFYWQVGDFGLKPVHRMTHVIIGKGQGQHGEAYLLASKMLFASHYFRRALELRFLIPGQDPRKGDMMYLVTVQRSYVDGLTGLKGKLIRGTILGKSRDSMERYIAGVKNKVESKAKQARQSGD